MRRGSRSSLRRRAADVYGLVRTAFTSNNPTVIVTHAKLLGIEAEVPADKKPIPFGSAASSAKAAM